MKLAINRMKDGPVEDEMVKSIRERLHQQFKEDENELATSQRRTSKA